MHELGLARAIASELRARGHSKEPVCIRVSGAYAEPEAFEQSLLAHLLCEGPEFRERSIRVEFVETERLCSVCALSFKATARGECPSCGGRPLPSFEHEQIELEFGPGVEATCA